MKQIIGVILMVLLELSAAPVLAVGVLADREIEQYIAQYNSELAQAYFMALQAARQAVVDGQAEQAMQLYTEAWHQARLGIQNGAFGYRTLPNLQIPEGLEFLDLTVHEAVAAADSFNRADLAVQQLEWLTRSPWRKPPILNARLSEQMSRILQKLRDRARAEKRWEAVTVYQARLDLELHKQAQRAQQQAAQAAQRQIERDAARQVFLIVLSIVIVLAIVTGWWAWGGMEYLRQWRNTPRQQWHDQPPLMSFRVLARNDEGIPIAWRNTRADVMGNVSIQVLLIVFALGALFFAVFLTHYLYHNILKFESLIIWGMLWFIIGLCFWFFVLTCLCLVFGINPVLRYVKLSEQTFSVSSQVGFLLQQRQQEQFGYDQIRKLTIQACELSASPKRLLYWQLLVELSDVQKIVDFEKPDRFRKPVRFLETNLKNYEQRIIVLAGAQKKKQLTPLIHAINRYRCARFISIG